MSGTPPALLEREARRAGWRLAGGAASGASATTGPTRIPDSPRQGRWIRATVRAAPAGAGGAIAGDHSAPGDAAAAAESEER